MFPSSLDSFFQNINLPYGMSLPIAALALIALFAVPGMLRGGHAWHTAAAAYHYLAQSLGVILLTAGGVPVVQAVLSGQEIENVSYIALLFVFAIGGLLLLWNDGKLRHIDAASKAVAGALFFYTWKLIGLLVTIFSALSLLLSIVLGALGAGTDTMVSMTHVTMLVYGLLLSWFTSGPKRGGTVTTRTLVPVSSAAKKSKSTKKR